MADEVVVVVPATETGTDGAAAETAEVAAAATEAVTDAFREGVMAAEDAGRRDDSTRDEVAELRRRVEELEALTRQTEVVAEVALEVAAEAATEAAEAEGGPEANDGPKPPPRRAEADEPATTAPPAAKPSYGATGWFGARK